MTWLGWLTKPALMVTLLDRIIMTVELSVLGILAVYCWYGLKSLRKRK